MLTQQAIRARVVIALAGATIALIAFAATFHTSNSADLSGTWDLTSIDGHRIDPRSQRGDQMVSFDLRADGTFSMPPSTGTWKVDGTNLTLHTMQYDGKTQQQFQADMAANHPGDASMQKIAEKVFEDLKYTVDADGATLTTNLGGTIQTYSKHHK